MSNEAYTVPGFSALVFSGSHLLHAGVCKAVHTVKGKDFPNIDVRWVDEHGDDQIDMDVPHWDKSLTQRRYWI